MNLKNIKVNQKISNYKDLCNLLGEDIKNGDSKKAQIKNWERYFKYHKDRYTFVIDVIYPEPLPEPFRTDDIYTAYMQVVLCNYLTQGENLTNGCSCLKTKKQLFEILGLVNSDYIQVDNINNSGESKWDLNQFNQRLNSRFSNILYKCLNRLKKKKYIIYNDHYTICETINEKQVYRDATDKEIGIYLDEIQRLKSELSVTYINDYNNLKFYTELNKSLFKKYGWDKCYKQIKIIIAPTYIHQALQEGLEMLASEVERCKLSINDNAVKLLYGVIENDYKKNKQEINCKKIEICNNGNNILTDWITDYQVKEVYSNQQVFNDSYVKKQKEMVDLFVKLNISEQEQ